MKKNYLVFICMAVALVGVLLLSMVGNSEYTVFKPVVMLDEKFVEDATADPREKVFIDKIVFVLNHYGVAYRVTSDGVEVPTKVYSDKELMYNYTRKARDPRWIEMQQAKP